MSEDEIALDLAPDDQSESHDRQEQAEDISSNVLALELSIPAEESQSTGIPEIPEVQDSELSGLSSPDLPSSDLTPQGLPSSTAEESHQGGYTWLDNTPEASVRSHDGVAKKKSDYGIGELSGLYKLGGVDSQTSDSGQLPGLGEPDIDIAPNPTAGAGAELMDSPPEELLDISGQVSMMNNLENLVDPLPDKESDKEPNREESEAADPHDDGAPEFSGLTGITAAGLPTPQTPPITNEPSMATPADNLTGVQAAPASKEDSSVIGQVEFVDTNEYNDIGLALDANLDPPNTEMADSLESHTYGSNTSSHQPGSFEGEDENEANSAAYDILNSIDGPSGGTAARQVPGEPAKRGYNALGIGGGQGGGAFSLSKGLKRHTKMFSGKLLNPSQPFDYSAPATDLPSFASSGSSLKPVLILGLIAAFGVVAYLNFHSIEPKLAEFLKNFKQARQTADSTMAQSQDASADNSGSKEEKAATADDQDIIEEVLDDEVAESQLAVPGGSISPGQRNPYLDLPIYSKIGPWTEGYRTPLRPWTLEMFRFGQPFPGKKNTENQDKMNAYLSPNKEYSHSSVERTWNEGDLTRRMASDRVWPKYEMVFYIRHHQLKEKIPMLNALLDSTDKPWLMLYTMSALIDLGVKIDPTDVDSALRDIPPRMLINWVKKFRKTSGTLYGEISLMRIMIRMANAQGRLEILRTFRHHRGTITNQYLAAGNSDPDQRVRSFAAKYQPKDTGSSYLAEYAASGP